MQSTMLADVLFCAHANDYQVIWRYGEQAVGRKTENRGVNPEINVVVVVHITHWYTLSSSAAYTRKSIATSLSRDDDRVPSTGGTNSAKIVPGRERRIVLFASCGLHRPHLRFLSVLRCVFRSIDVSLVSFRFSRFGEEQKRSIPRRHISLAEASTTAVRL